jgi:hypothetical protein
MLNALLAAFTVVLAAIPALAQSDSIRPSPNAVELRPMWIKEGGYWGAYYGTAIAPIGDINGDSLIDFAVNGIDSMWIYHGARPRPSTDASASYPTRTTGGIPHLQQRIHGDFWGTGHQAIVMYKLGTPYYPDLVVYRTESGRIADSPATRLYRFNGADRTDFPAMTVADLDADGFDDLIVGSDKRVHDGVGDIVLELMIFRGGPDFSLDAPDLIIRDTEKHGGTPLWLRTGDFDGDRHVDIASMMSYPSQGRKLKLFFGTGDLATFPRLPQSVSYNVSFNLHVCDVDGDRIDDIYIMRGLIFLSSSGKNARTRSYAFDDADVRLFDAYQWTHLLGYLNDDSRRYAMVGKGVGTLLAFSGGPHGPDPAYDAHFRYHEWDRQSIPLGDVNGDGWDDVLFSSDTYPFEGEYRGIAIILSGGAYIPRDSLPASAIRDVGIDRHRDAFTLWPIPATSELHVAWRGDLPRNPRSYMVHDISGALVAHGDIGVGASTFVWPCASMSHGVYLITLLDNTNTPLLSERVAVQ